VRIRGACTPGTAIIRIVRQPNFLPTQVFDYPGTFS
jgi:hypothetical protein